LGRALMLNASFEPLCVVSARRAVVLVLKEKAEIVHRNGAEFHAERVTVPVPTVIRLRHYVRVPYRSVVPLSRRAVFARDGHRCQYCGRPAENLDHVQPRSRGGAHVWENVVAACAKCNHRKADRLLTEIGWTLTFRPVQPVVSGGFAAGYTGRHPTWEPYLSAWAPAEAAS
jgi:5-methylcytosine-specific restriction endonuclease McrA